MFLKIDINILHCKKEKLQVLDSFTLITFILERRIIMGYISYYIIWKKNKNIIGVFHVVTKWATTTNQTIKFLN